MPTPWDEEQLRKEIEEAEDEIDLERAEAARAEDQAGTPLATVRAELELEWAKKEREKKEFEDSLNRAEEKH